MQNVNINKIKSQDFQINEAYKQLRTNIQFSGSSVKAIALTSCIPGEGKSSVSLNLAISLAEAGKKVIFLDCDLRKSVLAGRHKVNKGGKGMTHYLTGQNSFDEVAMSSNIENLHVVFAGPVPPNPSELLGDESFKTLIPLLKRRYDYVIIDTPPLGSVIDAAVVAKECDGAVLIIESGKISNKFAKRTLSQLEKSNCRILGTILNKVDISEKSYYGRYYGKYYGKYYGN